MTDFSCSTGSAGPIAWMVQRECDPTFPRLFMSHAKATELLNYCNVGPLPTIHPLYLDVAQQPIPRGDLPPLVDRAELIALLQDLASVNLSREAVERQARRMADDLIARGCFANAYPPAEPFIKEVERLRAGLQSIVDCVNPLTRAAVREACAEILAGTPSLPSTDREGT